MRLHAREILEQVMRNFPGCHILKIIRATLPAYWSCCWPEARFGTYPRPYNLDSISSRNAFL